MNESKETNEISKYSPCDYENNNISSIAEFDNEPGFYQVVIKPMLAPGHEGELVSWLKSTGLIPQSQKCKNASLNSFCEAPMTWTPAKRMDNYEWRCSSCSQKRTIRDDSIFYNVKCKFKDAIRVLLGWCKGNDIESLANILQLRKSVISGLYNIANATADKFVVNNLNEFKLGGPGVVVLIDTYPDVNSNIGQQEFYANAKLILCLAEVKDIPTRFWLEHMERFNRSSKEQVNNANQTALKIIQGIVRPGSVLVVNLNTTIANYETCLYLTQHNYTVISTAGISRHDRVMQTLAANLEVIWKPALDVCEEAQNYRNNEVQNFLIRKMWRRRFRREGFQMLLNQLAYGG